ncbi:MAG: hypothetical protein OFPII_09220 [Osedax symbiont Rs1]|nr:MAG: hypothetical protein OFPII_09220 [Osedax symbiont Rs1]
MDGTGILFEPLLKLISGTIQYEVIALSKFQSDTPSAQAAELAIMIANQEVIIFAESYSGLIAYELCKLQSGSIKHVFFAAGFLERPSFISQYARLLPITILRYKLIPAVILSYLFFARSSNRELVDLFYQSLGSVSNKTLRTRLEIIAQAKRPVGKIKQPSTYLCASNDWLVNKNVITTFKRLCVNFELINVTGGHFIAQSNPEKCWQEVRRVIIRLQSAAHRGLKSE